jgi:hypothetical protein
VVLFVDAVGLDTLAPVETHLHLDRKTSNLTQLLLMQYLHPIAVTPAAIAAGPPVAIIAISKLP